MEEAEDGDLRPRRSEFGEELAKQSLGLLREDSFKIHSDDVARIMGRRNRQEEGRTCNTVGSDELWSQVVLLGSLMSNKRSSVASGNRSSRFCPIPHLCMSV